MPRISKAAILVIFLCTVALSVQLASARTIHLSDPDNRSVVIKGSTGAQSLNCPVQDINGDGKDDIVMNIINQQNFSYSTYVWYGKATKIDTDADHADVVIPNFLCISPFLTEDVTKKQDIDNDGFDDIKGIRFNQAGEAQQINNYTVIWGQNNLPSTIDFSTFTGFTDYNTQSENQGSATVEHGDLNGDGNLDFLTTENVSTEPLIYVTKVLYGNGNRVSRNLLTEASFTITANAQFVALKIADLNQDGFDDIIGSSWMNTDLKVIWGSATPVNIDLATATAAQVTAIPTALLPHGGNQIGSFSAHVGDVTGDSLSDLVLSGVGQNSTEIKILRGPIGPASNLNTLNSESIRVNIPARISVKIGRSNADAVQDLFVAAPTDLMAGTSYQDDEYFNIPVDTRLGRVIVIPGGNTLNTVDLATVELPDTYDIYWAPRLQDGFGFAYGANLSLGDYNGDGQDDFIASVANPQTQSLNILGHYTQQPNTPVTDLANVSAPSITGAAVVTAGAELTCTPGTWNKPVERSIQWLRNSEAVNGQTSPQYTTSEADINQVVQCKETVTAGGQTLSATSNMVVVVAQSVVVIPTDPPVVIPTNPPVVNNPVNNNPPSIVPPVINPPAIGTKDCTMIGTKGNDVIYGTDKADVICGFGGDDIIYAGAGHDVVSGGAGRDTIYGQAGHDIIIGGADADKLIGGIGSDQLFGAAGNDVISAGSGKDIVSGGSGNDRLNSGSDDDIIFAGTGNDTVLAGSGDDYIIGQSGNDRILGEAGHDRIFGSAGNDILSGGAGKDVIYGHMGNDKISGGAGDDTLFGNAGNDSVSGGSGNDFISGGLGTDNLLGGSGKNDIQDVISSSELAALTR